jgi:hypothetical protein
MMRLAGLALGAVCGFVVGRNLDEIRALLAQVRARAAQVAPDRRWDDESEYAREYELDAAHRHEVAEQIRRRPLRERPDAQSDADRIASQPIRRERDDHPYPTSY